MSIEHARATKVSFSQKFITQIIDLFYWCSLMIGEEVAKLEETIMLLKPKLEQILLSQEFIKGVAIGLFYGIIGNIIVLHYYKAFERLILGEFDTLLLANLIVFVVAFVTIFIGIKKWRGRAQKVEEYRHEIFQAAEMLRDYYELIKKETKGKKR